MNTACVHFREEVIVDELIAISVFVCLIVVKLFAFSTTRWIYFAIQITRSANDMSEFLLTIESLRLTQYKADILNQIITLIDTTVCEHLVVA